MKKTIYFDNFSMKNIDDIRIEYNKLPFPYPESELKKRFSDSLIIRDALCAYLRMLKEL